MYFACIINDYSNTCLCGHEKNGIKLAIFLTNMHGTSNWFWMDNQALFGTYLCTGTPWIIKWRISL